jgi:hypothetical protein
MKRIWMAPVLLSVVTLAACGSSSDTAAASFGENAGPARDGSGAPSGGGMNSGSAPPTSESGGTSSDPTGATTGTPGAEQKGTLTAGVWDDNLNFDFFKKYVDLSTPALQGLPSFSAAEREAAKQKWMSPRAAVNELDVAFLIDTTGSMGDELTYLQNEIDGISQTIKTKFPQTTPRFGLVLYKDQGDAYLTRWFDFKGLEEFRSNLAVQTVGGGGDYPEAVAAGLDQTMKLTWRAGAVARMTFWVADAPHHIGEEASVWASIDAAVAKDVHVYPVAASGTDERAELTMRTAAQITGGRYVFLTDDSGIGEGHEVPKIPCYQVQRLNDLMVRLVEVDPASGLEHLDRDQ